MYTKYEFYFICSQVPKEQQEFSMAMTSLSDSIGISLSGILAIPLHNAICHLPKWNYYPYLKYKWCILLFSVKYKLILNYFKACT